MEKIRSPRVRRYLQLRARVMADTSSRYGRPAELRSIRVHLTDIYADELLGEVWPAAIAEIGLPEERSFFIRPVFGSVEQWFDEVRIRATAATTLKLLEVLTGTREDFAKGRALRNSPDQLEMARSGGRYLAVPPAVTDPQRGGVDRGAHGAGDLLPERYVRSRGQGQRSGRGLAGCRCRGRHRPDTRPNQCSARLRGQRGADRTRREPPIFTPNGDGFNDAAVFSFSLNRLTGEKSVGVSVYDLGGRLVRKLGERRTDPRGKI